MGCIKHLTNGIVSLVISVGITVAFADEGEEYGLSDVALSVAIAAFFSGLFTSYFANDS
jgi:cellobiose-specific phosphotransferase system component IIC